MSVSSSSSLASSSSLLGLTEDIRTEILSYVSTHQEEWNDELTTTKKTSLFIRRCDSKLPFSIEYWRDDRFKRSCKQDSLFPFEYWSDVMILVYPKGRIGRGRENTVSYAIDLYRNIIYARRKPRSIKYQKDLIIDTEVTDLFRNKLGIVQNLYHSFYLSKDNKMKKFHVIQELYSGSFLRIHSRKMSDEVLKATTLSLLIGLQAIHDKGIAHGDINDGNILFKEKFGIITKADICDLPSDIFEQTEKEAPEKIHFWQRCDTRHLLRVLYRLYTYQEKTCPKFIKDTIKNLDDFPTSKDAFEKLVSYYQQESQK